MIPTRDDIAERVRAAPASDLFKQMKSVIAPKRGPSVSTVNLTASELNAYFCSIGRSTRDTVMADFERSGRQSLDVRLPRIHTGALNIIPVTLDHLHSVIYSMPDKDSCVPGGIFPNSATRVVPDLSGRSCQPIRDETPSVTSLLAQQHGARQAIAAVGVMMRWLTT